MNTYVLLSTSEIGVFDNNGQIRIDRTIFGSDNQSSFIMD